MADTEKRRYRTQAQRLRESETADREWQTVQEKESAEEEILLKEDGNAIPWGKYIALFLILAAVLTAAFFWGRNKITEISVRRAQYLLEQEKANYPLLYREWIDQYAAEQQIDPALVAAMIYCESRFKPEATSGVGAKGLMQILDSTGEWIAQKLGEKKEDIAAALYDPCTSIRYGTWYLHFLQSLFGSDRTVIAAAYHAGQGIVAEWLKDPRYSRDGVHLSDIPYADTKAYTKEVERVYELYCKHYYPQEQAGS